MATVVIVGAGPAGAALAYVLASRGIDVTLLERQVDFAREFRGEGLQPAGIEALRQLGLEAQLDQLPQARIHGVQLHHGRRPVLEYASGALSGADEGPRLVSQPALLEMLVAEASRFPSFRLIRGATVRGLLEVDGRTMGVRADAPDGERHLHADLVIGTDGRGSTVRRLAGFQEEKRPQSFDVVWCKLPFDTGAIPGIARIFVGRGHMLAVFPAYDGRLQLGWVIRKGRFGALRRQGFDAWLEALAAQVPADFAAHLRARKDEVTQPFLLNAICDRLETWTRPGLLLLGDAAHPMSPVGGQGINVALRDVLVAANHLCPVLKNGGTAAQIDAAAHAVQVERLPEVVRLQTLQERQARIILGDSPLSAVLLRLLPWILKLRFLRRLSGGRARAFARGLLPVRLEV